MIVEHRFANVLRWVAEGKEIQGEFQNGWRTLSHKEVLSIVADSCLPAEEFRVKPATVGIDSHEAILPVTAPSEGQVLWFWDVSAAEPVQITYSSKFRQSAKEGELFLSSAAAEAAYLRGEA